MSKDYDNGKADGQAGRGGQNTFTWPWQKRVNYEAGLAEGRKQR